MLPRDPGSVHSAECLGGRAWGCRWVAEALTFQVFLVEPMSPMCFSAARTSLLARKTLALNSSAQDRHVPRLWPRDGFGVFPLKVQDRS